MARDYTKEINTYLKSVFFKLVIVFSAVMMTLVTSSRGNNYFILFGLLLSLAVVAMLIFKVNLLEKIFDNFSKKHLIVSAVLSVYAGYCFSRSLYSIRLSAYNKIFSLINIPSNYHALGGQVVSVLLCAAAMPAICIFLYASITKLHCFFKDFLQTLTKGEKLFLVICLAVFIVLMAVVFSQTNIFYAPRSNGNVIYYNTIFTSDSGSHLAENVYININASENDIRQPLFAVFSMPFALPAAIVSEILFFIPNIYPVLVNVVQIFLLMLGFIMLSKILNLKGLVNIMFLVLIVCLYPTFLYSLCMEQYIFAVFWLFMFIYSYIMKKENKDYYFIAASGSLLTSGVFFPLLSRERQFKKWFSEIFFVALKFLVFIIIFGQFATLLNAVSTLKTLTQYAEVGASFSFKFTNFIAFVAMCFVSPLGGGNLTAYEHISYQLMPITTINYLGAVLLLLAVSGFIINRKDVYARICFSWVVFSYILIGVAGWGVAENGVVLYALYFSWAYFSLIFMFIEKLFSKFKAVRCGLYALSAAALLFINISGIYQLIEFGIKYYPAGVF